MVRGEIFHMLYPSFCKEKPLKRFCFRLVRKGNVFLLHFFVQSIMKHLRCGCRSLLSRGKLTKVVKKKNIAKNFSLLRENQVAFFLANQRLLSLSQNALLVKNVFKVVDTRSWNCYKKYYLENDYSDEPKQFDGK